MSISKKAAHGLAVSYAAYVSAEDDLATIVWGQALLQDQEKTGVVLFDPEALRGHIKSAKRRRDAAKALNA